LAGGWSCERTKFKGEKKKMATGRFKYSQKCGGARTWDRREGKYINQK